MNADYDKVVLTYGLTKEENELLIKQHREFEFEDVSNYFTDLLAQNPFAMIINPDKLSQDELELLVEVCLDSYTPLSILQEKSQR